MYVYMYICVYMYMYIYVQMCVYVYTVVARQNARATFADGACQIAGTMPKRTSTWQLAPISLLAPTLFTERVKTFRLVRDYFSSSGVSIYTCVQKKEESGRLGNEGSKRMRARETGNARIICGASPLLLGGCVLCLCSCLILFPCLCL